MVVKYFLFFEDWILTAAHCLVGNDGIVDKKIENIFISLGDTDQTNLNNPDVKVFFSFCPQLLLRFKKEIDKLKS
jgi:hypothetical protein